MNVNVVLESKVVDLIQKLTVVFLNLTNVTHLR